ncbi:MAG TPA: YciI family protein [Holophagaceae bacterium]|nr:YciI family protein [Holophagaceae bacterium]
MYAIAILRYRKPLDEVLKVVEEHRAYLRELKAKGILLASGPMDPRNGGILLLRVPEQLAVQAELDRIRDEDPFTRTGCAQYEVMPWAPTIGLEELDRL